MISRTRIGLRRALVGMIAAALASAVAPSAGLARPAAKPATPAIKYLPIETLTLVASGRSVRVQAEIADTDAERERGLMYRRAMAPDHGMLFDFKTEKPVYFWMKNTVLPLDMIFIAANGRIVAIAPDTTPFSLDPVGPGVPVLAVLEVGAGRAAAWGLHPGDFVQHRIFRPR